MRRVFGAIRLGDDIAETNRARSAFQAAERSLRDTRNKVTNERQELDELFSPEWYGSSGEWKKLHNTCLEKESGE